MRARARRQRGRGSRNWAGDGCCRCGISGGQLQRGIAALSACALVSYVPASGCAPSSKRASRVLARNRRRDGRTPGETERATVAAQAAASCPSKGNARGALGAARAVGAARQDCGACRASRRPVSGRARPTSLAKRAGGSPGCVSRYPSRAGAGAQVALLEGERRQAALHAPGAHSGGAPPPRPPARHARLAPLPRSSCARACGACARRCPSAARRTCTSGCRGTRTLWRASTRGRTFGTSAPTRRWTPVRSRPQVPVTEAGRAGGRAAPSPDSPAP